MTEFEKLMVSGVFLTACTLSLIWITVMIGTIKLGDLMRGASDSRKTVGNFVETNQKVVLQPYL